MSGRSVKRIPLAELREKIGTLPRPAVDQLDWTRIEKKVLQQLQLDVRQPGAFAGRSLFFWFQSSAAPFLVASAVVLFVITGAISFGIIKFTPAAVVQNTADARPSVMLVQGAAQYSDSLQWHSLSQPRRVHNGVSLKTGTDGIVFTALEDSTAVALDTNTQLRVDSAANGSFRFSLKRGAVAAVLKKRSAGQTFEVATDLAHFIATGTAFRVSVEDTKGSVHASKLVVEHGTVLVVRGNRRGDTLQVGAGESVVVGDGSISRGTADLIGAEADPLLLALSRRIGSFGALQQRQPTLFVTSAPPGAQVVCNGEPIGKTPLWFSVAHGEYTLQIRAGGYAPWQTHLHVGQDKEYHLLAHMRADEPVPVVAAAPVAAPPIALPDLSAGLHRGAGFHHDLVAASAPGVGSLFDDKQPKQPLDSLNSRFLAGALSGQNLYWYNPRLELDTLGWHALLDLSPHETPRHLQNFPGVLGHLGRQKKQLLSVQNAMAVELAFLLHRGYRIFCLTQWSAAVEQPRGDVRDKIEDNTILSHFLWEEIDSAYVVNPHRQVTDYRLKLFFTMGGYCIFSGREMVDFSRSQILGTRGFVFAPRYRDYIADANLYRVVTKISLVTDTDISVEKIRVDLQNHMDAKKLDVSYKVPLIAPVSQN
jgi:hypothetical protein